jgi:hypothetical protein
MFCAPPHSYGTFRKAHADGTIDVSVDGRTLKVNVHPKLTFQEFRRRQLLKMNEAYNVVGVAGYEVKDDRPQARACRGRERERRWPPISIITHLSMPCLRRLN